jgi:hypothetical protein
MMRAPDDRRLSKALALLDPPPADRGRVAKNIQSALDMLGRNGDDLEFERDSAGLTRYINALRELKASRAALDPSIHRFLTLGEETVTLPFSGEVSVIEAEIREAEIMLEMCRRPGGHPANKWARKAVAMAGFVLEITGLERTTERKGKWHLLSQIFANTNRDLRHHLAAMLTRESQPAPPEPPTLQEVLEAVEMSRRETQKR